MKKRITCMAFLLIFTVSLNTKSIELKAANCADAKITIAEMTWASASMYAYLIQKIINDGYGCNSTIVPSDTAAAGASMLSKGTPTIAPELWTSSQPAILDETKKSNGKVFKASNSFTNGGVEGFWVPDYVYNDLGIQSVNDIIPNWKLFTEPTSPKKGRFYGCPPGWGCEITSTNLFNALNLGEKYEYFSPGSGAALKASIAKRVNAKKPVIGYYWDPTDVTGRYNLKKLSFPAYDADKWKCISDKNCENPQISDYPAAEVLVIGVSRLKKDAPKVTKFLYNVSIPNAEISAILGWQDKTKSTGEEAATKFLKENEQTWQAWVPKKIAQKIKKSL